MSHSLTAREMAARLSVTVEELLLDQGIPRQVRNQESFFDEAEVMEVVQGRKERVFNGFTGEEES